MENTNTKHLRHLYDLSHATPEVPELSSAYTLKMIKTFSKKGLTLPTQISQGTKFCSHCNACLISGFNMSMRIVYSKRKKNQKKNQKKQTNDWKPRSRVLRMTCFSCDGVTDHDVKVPNSPKDVEDYVPKKEKFVAEWKQESPMDKEKEKANKAKERAKKRKKNNLSNLLSGKKEAEAKEKQKSSLLSLDEFLKM